METIVALLISQTKKHDRKNNDNYRQIYKLMYIYSELKFTIDEVVSQS